MQTTGATLIVVERRSLMRMWMPAQASRSTHGLLYLAAVRDGWRKHQDRYLSNRPVQEVAVASVVQQLPALIGVAVGAIASYLVATATERRRWQRQQSTRWDVKRAEAYVDYGNAVKNVSYKCGSIGNFRGLGWVYEKIDENDALSELGRLASERSAKWETLLLLGDVETLRAAREWHRLVGELQRFILDNQTDAGEWKALVLQADAARSRFYGAARRDLGIRGEPLPPGGPWHEPGAGLRAEADRSPEAPPSAG